jgi:hypothetical protein
VSKNFAHQVIQYLREENRILKARLRTRRVRFTDDERRRVAASGPAAARAARDDR